MNQQAGGQGKGLSKLTKAQRVDTRREVARLAGVSSGNVRKVKHISAHACTSLLQAARAEEVSINLADKWSHEPPAQQQEYLRRLRIERGIQKKARSRVTAHLPRISSSTQDHQVIKLPDLVALLNQLAARAAGQSINVGSIEVAVVNAPGRIIFVTRELIQFLTPRQGILVR